MNTENIFLLCIVCMALCMGCYLQTIFKHAKEWRMRRRWHKRLVGFVLTAVGIFVALSIVVILLSVGVVVYENIQ